METIYNHPIWTIIFIWMMSDGIATIIRASKGEKSFFRIILAALTALDNEPSFNLPMKTPPEKSKEGNKNDGSR